MAVHSYHAEQQYLAYMIERPLFLLLLKKPEKSLTVTLTKTAGRNNQGRITTRHRGGGVKRAYRMVDFVFAAAKNAEIIALEYDPNRSANIALVRFEDGTKAYVLATANMKVGKSISAGEDVEIKSGNRLKLAILKCNQVEVGSWLEVPERAHSLQLVKVIGLRLNCHPERFVWCMFNVWQQLVR